MRRGVNGGRRWLGALLGRPRLLVVAVALLVAAPVLILGQASENETRARLRTEQIDGAARTADVISSSYVARVLQIRDTLVSLALSPRPDASPIGLAVQRGDVATLQAIADAVQRLYPHSVLRAYIAVPGQADTIVDAMIVAASPAGSDLVGRRLSDLNGPASEGVRTIVGNRQAAETGFGTDDYPGTAAVPSVFAIAASIPIGRVPPAHWLATIVTELDDARTFADAAGPSLALGDDAYLLMLKPERRLIGRARGPTAFPWLDVSGDPFVQLIGPTTLNVARAGVADPLGAGSRLIASAPLSLSPSYSVLFVRDTSELDREVDAALSQLAIFRLLLVVLLLIATYLFARVAAQVVRQRRALAESLERQTALGVELGDKSRQLEIASRHKSEFLANMSHELRTPLNAIIGFSDVLDQRMFGELNDRQTGYVRDIAGSGRHLLDLVNEILDLSKIEAGRMELEPSEFALADTIRGALAFVRERAARHGIELAADVSDDLGTIFADERKVRQVLLNLLSNAVKFTPDGGRIGVSARRLDGEIQISVRDTGVGIAPEDQSKVFDEFQQVGKPSDRSHEGTGLGLTLAKRFIELHGGRIRVESEVGKGTTFTFAIPVLHSV